MNLRRKTPQDSLYLLLDTLCNAFGGIILLAVLVVLLTSKEKAESAKASVSQEMVERRLTLAQKGLEQALAATAELREKVNRSKDQMALLAQRKDLQEKIRQTRESAADTAKELAAANAVDPAERLKLLQSELAAAQARKLAATNDLAAADEDIKRLQDRIAGMEAQIQNKLQDLERPLRLPKEHETANGVVYVIVKYGKVYPCNNADMGRDETDIHWTLSPLTETAEPIPTAGMDPVNDRAALVNYFQALSRNQVYVVFCTFEDSFPAFMRAKAAALGCGIDYGWDPFREEDGPVTFSAFGSRPKPQ